MMKLLVYGGLVDNLVKKNDLTGLGIIEVKNEASCIIGLNVIQILSYDHDNTSEEDLKYVKSRIYSGLGVK